MSDTLEQQARDLLNLIGVPYAQEYSAGDLVVLANFIADKEQCERDLAAARGRIDGYQASRDWSIRELAVALGVEFDAVRALEYYVSQAVESIKQARAAERTATDAYVAEQKVTQQLQRELAQAQADRAKLVQAADRYGDGADWVQRALQAEAELEQARENPIVTVTTPNGKPACALCAVDGCQFLQVTIELEQARRDAERYQWLREHVRDRNVWQPIDAPERFDAAIDAAMEQGK